MDQIKIIIILAACLAFQTFFMILQDVGMRKIDKTLDVQMDNMEEIILNLGKKIDSKVILVKEKNNQECQPIEEKSTIIILMDMQTRIYNGSEFIDEIDNLALLSQEHPSLMEILMEEKIRKIAKNGIKNLCQIQREFYQIQLLRTKVNKNRFLKIEQYDKKYQNLEKNINDGNLLEASTILGLHYPENEQAKKWIINLENHVFAMNFLTKIKNKLLA